MSLIFSLVQNLTFLLVMLFSIYIQTNVLICHLIPIIIFIRNAFDNIKFGKGGFLPIHEFGNCLPLFRFPFLSFTKVLIVFIYKSLVCFIKLIPTYFMSCVATILVSYFYYIF